MATPATNIPAHIMLYTGGKHTAINSAAQPLAAAGAKKAAAAKKAAIKEHAGK